MFHVLHQWWQWTHCSHIRDMYLQTYIIHKDLIRQEFIIPLNCNHCIMQHINQFPIDLTDQMYLLAYMLLLFPAIHNIGNAILKWTMNIMRDTAIISTSARMVGRFSCRTFLLCASSISSRNSTQHLLKLQEQISSKFKQMIEKLPVVPIYCSFTILIPDQVLMR